MKKAIPLYLFVSAFMLMSSIVMGQLSGTYTINGSSPTGGTNYQTFTAAVSALSTSGISGAVTFNVAAGTYTEQISIPAINGASTTNTITFKGLGTSTVITAAPTSANLPIISLDSASHISIEDLKIVITGTDGWGIHFMRHADTNTVTGCVIEGPVLSGIYGIIGSGSTTGVSVVQNNGEYLTITNNTIDGCDRSIQFVGKTGPLTTPSKKVNYGTNLNISNNSFTNFRGKAVIANHYHNVTVEGNTATTSSTNSNGAFSFWDAGDNIVVSKNNIYVSSNTNNTRMIVMAMAPGNGPAGDSTKPGIVSNNMIQYDGTNSTAPTGLLLKNKDQIKIYHNTFKMNNQGSNANCIWLDNSNARSLYGIEIRNNIMVLNNSGSGQFLYTANSTLAARFDDLEVDHNNYYAPNGYFKSLVSNGTNLSTFNSFAAYKANTYGWATGALNVDPQFLSPTDLHVKSTAMNDSGAVISSITTDIDGQTRSTTFPDIGADEYVPPSCVASTGLGVFNVFATSADVYWAQSNTGSTYKLQYGTAGFTLGTGTTIVPTNDTVALTGLSPQTTYDFYVKEYCSATDSSTWVSYSFTTGCGIVSSYPYFESFEGSDWVSGSGTTNSGYAFDPCWTRTPATGFGWGTRSGSTSSGTTGPTNAFGGSKYVFTEGSTGSIGDKSNFISPGYDLSSLTAPQLSFHYHMYGGDMGTFEVWAWNGTAYDTLMSISGNQGNAWVEAIVDLSMYANDTTHLVFHGVRGSSFRTDMAIDSIVIGEAPPCPKPSVVTFDSITANSVNLVFSSSGHTFNVEFGPSGFTQGTGTTTTITGSGDTITGLTPNTLYDFYLRNNCTDSSNGFSTWVGPFTVRTECSYTNSYFTNWDNLSNTETDICWTFLEYGATASYARAYDPSASIALQPFSGNIYYRYYNSSATETFLVSPEITDLPTNTLQLRFQASDSYTGSTGTPEFYIGTMVSENDTASFTPLDTVTTLTNVWTEFTVLLTGVPASHKYVVIKHAHNANNVYMAIDDLYIEVQPACIAPSLGVFSDIRDTSAVLNWTAGDGNTFDIEYGTTGFTQGLGTTISGLTSTTDTLTGLIPDTCYDVYIRGNCTSNNSPWYGPISFCTECATKVAPYLEDFEGSSWIKGTAATNAIDGCWVRTPESSSSSYRWETNFGSTPSSSTGPSAGAGGSGKYVYTEASRGSNYSLAYLEMPKVDFSGLTTPALSFSYHMYGSNMGELYVLLNDGTQTDTIWSISGQQQVDDTTAWITAYVDISAYMAQPATISFLGKKGGGINGDIAIDDVSIDELPSCLTPSGFTLDSVYTTFADFSWGSTSNGTAFKMEYGPTGFRQASATGTYVYSSSSPTRVSGLMPGTTYDIYLSDMCDSTNWIGPITFTTIIQHDAEVESLVSPFTLICGDSSMVVEIKVKNNGIAPITSLPVGANITGAISTSISSTYSGSIAPGASAVVQVGTVNAYMGGNVNVEVNANLSNDQNTGNDTLIESGMEVISAVPLHMPVDSICANDTAGIFVAIPQTGILHNWYANAQDVTPIATGDTVSVQPGQTLYLDRSQANSLVVQSGTAGSLYGSMFKIYVKQDFVFSGYTWVSHQTGAKSLKAFYKMGDYKGHETTRSSWTLIDSLEQANSSSVTAYRFDFRNPVTFNAGDTISIYLASKTGKYEAQSIPSATVDSVYKTTNDFEYIAGVGGAYFGSNMVGATTATSIALTLHWESLDVCGNNRIALTMGVNNDTAVADFSATVNANGADVDFDGSASSGHVYDWDFGDGNSGSGMMTSNTYASSGNYTVTLTVTDTVCGTVDTISKTVTPTIGLSEFTLSGSIDVYPNPNNGTFNIDFDLDGNQDIQLSLVNSMGQIVYQKYLGTVDGQSKVELNADHVAPGVYYLNVIANGKRAITRVTVFH